MSDMKIAGAELARMIDHTLLKPEATPSEVESVCAEAVEYKFASACVNPSFVVLVKEKLKGSSVKVCTVIGFPLGATTTASKVRETGEAISNGAQEVDMVVNIGRLKAGDVRYVEEDIRAVVDLAHSRSAIAKVIIETCLLTEEEKERVCLIAKKVGADFVKTSTGFSKGGATASDVSLMRRVVGPSMGVKASGGIRTYADALLMIEHGATRIGASSGVRIIRDSIQ